MIIVYLGLHSSNLGRDADVPRIPRRFLATLFCCFDDIDSPYSFDKNNGSLIKLVAIANFHSSTLFLRFINASISFFLIFAQFLSFFFSFFLKLFVSITHIPQIASIPIPTDFIAYTYSI